ncbi:hypothetical protein ACI2KV_07500 [Micromonospora chokoriensis]
MGRNVELLSRQEVPDGFVYPSDFLATVGADEPDLEPWWIFDGSLLRDRLKGLSQRYAGRKLVPFAKREDNDDVACWDLDRGNVVVIHDFASPGFEQRQEFKDFTAWLVCAREQAEVWKE